MGAAIAQWIRLRLPSGCPGFEFQAHHLCFYPNKTEVEKMGYKKIFARTRIG